MQDIHSVDTGTGGDGARFSGIGGSNGGDRRLRPHNHTLHHAPPAMKCPRCESLNTKFCYYNNYNLSQPRHFCKSCRRYWTKGGVLRNVPVGGGCRKTKRSKSKSNTSGERKSSNSQNSSSDSSTLIEKTTKTTTTTTSLTTNPVFSFQETNTTGFVTIPNSVNTVARNPSFEPFPEIGTFTSLITSTTTTQLGYNDISAFNQTEWLETEQQTIGEELKVQSPLGGFTEDWNNGTTDQALFDLTVDQSYWNQGHWNEHDHQLNYLR